MLDSQSNVSYSVKSASTPRAKLSHEEQYTKGISGHLSNAGEFTQITIKRHQDFITLPTRTPINEKDILGKCIGLIGAPHIKQLRISLDYAIIKDKHENAIYYDSTISDERRIQIIKSISIEQNVNTKFKEQQSIQKTMLSNQMIKQYSETHDDEFKDQPISLEDIQFNPKMPNEIKAQFKSLIKQYEHVFASNGNALPKPLKYAKPHIFQLKPDAKPVQLPKPKFGYEEAKHINKWLEWATNCKDPDDPNSEPLVIKAETTQWASHLLLVGKYNADTPKTSTPDGIRVCGNFVMVNNRLQKLIPTYSDPKQEIQIAAKGKYKFVADGLKQYWSIPISKTPPGNREVTTFWTPKGLYMFTRCVMGAKNSATAACNAYNHAMNFMLNQKHREFIANYADDFCGSGNSYQHLYQVFEAFLIMCHKSNILLKPSKVKIGYESAQF